MPRTFLHTPHDGLGLTVADPSLLEYNSNSSTLTKSAKHFKSFTGGISNTLPLPGIDAAAATVAAFDAVKDAERKAKNAASAKKSRQKKNYNEAKRDKQVDELKMKNEKLEDKVNLAKLAINALSSLVLDTKLLNLFGDSSTGQHAATTTTPEHGSFHQQMEQETLVSFVPNVNDVELGHVKMSPEDVFNLPFFLNANFTDSQQKKEADETKYSIEEALPQMQQNQSKPPKL